ncbi:MAG TPA: HAD family hydrolase [Clostridia bacterium]|nr:HAD family hydrolase [Clostridia bacterium]
MRFKAVLFDLDGTLLDIDMEEFFPVYFDALSRYFDHLQSKETFTRNLLEATRIMMTDRNPHTTNQQVFVECFTRLSGIDPSVFIPLFEEFYRKEYPGLGYLAKKNPSAPRVVEALRARGLDLVVATSPVFPRVAILERMNWAGLDTSMFRLITSYEVMHFSKPYPEYYEEILRIIGRSPGECLMVGNDVEDDMSAKDVGIRTFLVTRNVINRQCRPLNADFCGDLEDIPVLVSDEHVGQSGIS